MASCLENYFISPVGERSPLLASAATYIEATKLVGVLEALTWSIKPSVVESYDSGIDLLANCVDNSGYLFKAGKMLLRDFPSCNKWVKLEVEEKLEILAKGIGSNKNIASTLRVDYLVFFGRNTDRRLVKTAIIDALSYLEDEINVEQYLIYFYSDADEYVKKHALEVLLDRK